MELLNICSEHLCTFNISIFSNKTIYTYKSHERSHRYYQIIGTIQIQKVKFVVCQKRMDCSTLSFQIDKVRCRQTNLHDILGHVGFQSCPHQQHDATYSTLVFSWGCQFQYFFLLSIFYAHCRSMYVFKHTIKITVSHGKYAQELIISFH